MVKATTKNDEGRQLTFQPPKCPAAKGKALEKYTDNQIGIGMDNGEMKQKLLQAMKEGDDKVLIGGIVQLDDVYWGGESRGGKRGRGAAGKPPFVAAVA